MEDKVKIGLLGIGLETYWHQFGGLLARLTGYQEQIFEKFHDLESKCLMSA